MAERADAARNRVTILAVAEELYQRHEPGSITLARIAETAGVGKATVLRRFGDLNGLVEAVLAPKVAALRDALRTGAPPLGPGGTPAAQLHAYLDALFDFVLDNRVLIRALENRRPHAYYANSASQFWIDELDRRLRAVHPASDSKYLAYVVFTALRADVVEYLNAEQHLPIDRIRAGLHNLAALDPGSPSSSPAG
ncbi:TetR/AcrR family transcriptional regulator [Kribbella sp. NPDC026611]|uniref:TetR/AcrR family transcriptional regulator n=1 Tax=Kribbella sp. NPDC026611 TaxID=3154911 RepID=UPI0033F7503E